MAMLKIALLLAVCLEGCALASALQVDGVQSVPDDQRATGDVCQDCTKIIELLADMISNADLQKKVMDGIEHVCDLLPGPATTAKFCKDEVEKLLPVALNFIVGFVKPADVCNAIGLCGSSDEQEKMRSFLVKELLQLALTNENVQPTVTCPFCLLLIKTLEEMLPKDRTEDAVIKLLGEICHILPSKFRHQCEDIVGKFSKTVLDAIVSQATPQTICTLLHMCGGQEAPVVDPCTLATYRCRDMETAFKCGTVFYCQKFAWNRYNTL
ncbi:hypothetical protein JOQ06_008257 [Pogonophryne albipinna]|uniref:Saposin B-type domain-containing protein n=1 Tax=Pogonophryne albipinna TaxID=1090488 RepID=A0AAD6AJ66_9TELE|nr:hypothetical protein JOQ06_008257 [Pogonophryne albipinna]